MPVIDARTALSNVFESGPAARFPGPDDSRVQAGTLLPAIRPKFTIDPGERVFTIGSCFARNIEEHLDRLGYDIPTLAFSVPKSEWPYRSNGLLNEFNPAAIAQRIERAYSGLTEPEGTIVAAHDGWIDLLLPNDIAVSTRERAIERRSEITEVYRRLPLADVVIVTLGLREAWRDTDCGRYLNRMPPRPTIDADPGRYEVHAMDVDDCYSLLEPVFRTITDNGQRILLTVSPVPFFATFTGQDAIVANGMSKAVLRVCAEQLSERLALVDYFPSYEIVVTAGLSAYEDDNIHVTDEMVGNVVRWMLDEYRPAPRPVHDAQALPS